MTLPPWPAGSPSRIWSVLGEVPAGDLDVPFRLRLEHQLVQGYRICAALLGIFFLVLVPWRLSLAGQRPMGLFLAWEAVALAAFCLAFALLGSWLRPRAGAAENLALIPILAGLVNNLSLLVILREGNRICAQCKKVRNDEGYWQQVETYIGDHSEAEFTHGLCPTCCTRLEDEFEGIVPGEPRPD